MKAATLKIGAPKLSVPLSPLTATANPGRVLDRVHGVNRCTDLAEQLLVRQTSSEAVTEWPRVG